MNNVCIINKDTGICENIAVFENLEAARGMLKEYTITLQIDGFGIGDIFKANKWEKGKADTEITTPQPTLEEQITELQLAIAEVYEKIAR
nr:MAG TPA: hypothetical protein [Caudoviricetes sp.]